jgi:CHAT domain-containing protein
MGDAVGLTRGQINQAQALQVLGLYNAAIDTLLAASKSIDEQPDNLLKVKALQTLGDVLRGVGQLGESQKVLEKALTIAQEIQSPSSIAQTSIGLGNTAKATGGEEQQEKALKYYQDAIAAAPNSEIKVQAQLNQLSLEIDRGEWQTALELVPQIETDLAQLPLNRSSIYARINLAHNLRQYLQKQNDSAISQKTSQLLAEAMQQARQLGDKRAESYATGNLGRLYEQYEKFTEAQKLTEKALLISQSINATDLNYNWQWQLGRILRQQTALPEAISAYTQAVKNLQSLRGDLVAISSEAQFSFKESVEPIYREFVDLLLQANTSQENLQLARETIEALQLAELDNYFRDACLDSQPVQIDQLDPTAAIFYPIFLADRLEVIVAIPGQPLQNYSTQMSKATMERAINELRKDITSKINPKSLKPKLQNLYKWLISPIEEQLTANNITTLVFIPDGVLRNIPFSTLYDGEKYLVQKYSVSLAPGLQLIDSKPFARVSLDLLSAGVSEAREDFSALPGEITELNNIQTEIPSKTLLNDSFTESNFNTEIKASPYQIVHLATHGKFSSKPEDTFVLAWDDRINVTELNSLLRSNEKQAKPIELLVLSACQTAAGDNRAALGLAGVAVRAGARSTIASLWKVDDKATSLLMTNLYKELAKKDVSKAEALRRAQEVVLQEEEFSQPYYWSAFVLVGNWL